MDTANLDGAEKRRAERLETLYEKARDRFGDRDDVTLQHALAEVLFQGPENDISVQYFEVPFGLFGFYTLLEADGGEVVGAGLRFTKDGVVDALAKQLQA